MDFLMPPKHSDRLRRSSKLLICVLLFIISLLLYAFGRFMESVAFLTSWGLYGLVLSSCMVGLLGLHFLREILKTMLFAGEKLEQCLEAINRHRTLLMQISHAVRLSDTAKEIGYRDSEQIELGEAVISKIHQHEFESAQAMIQAMAAYPRYHALAQRLSGMEQKYRTATEEGRISQITHHLETLLDQHLWSQAASQIENLITLFPHSEKAQRMPARLQEKKNLYKRKLLADWDKAIQNKETDRSLEILKELDLYLTPAEALALQESASSVFKTKLHNLGVQFQMAVTEKNWDNALLAGREIVQKFPNSKMASEIRGKMDILQERAAQAQ